MENNVLTLDSWITIEGGYWGGGKSEIIDTIKVCKLTKTQAVVKITAGREFRLINSNKKGLLPYFQVVGNKQSYNSFSYCRARLATDAEVFRVKALQKIKAIDFGKCTTGELSNILEITNISID